MKQGLRGPGLLAPCHLAVSRPGFALIILYDFILKRGEEIELPAHIWEEMPGKHLVGDSPFQAVAAWLDPAFLRVGKACPSFLGSQMHF